MKLASAPASEDSDCETSDKLICPLSSLILSVSTCLPRSSTLALLISNFSFAEIKPVYAATVLYKISCSFFKSFAFAKLIPILLFDKSAPLPKSNNVWVTEIDLVLVSTSVIVAFDPSLFVNLSVSSWLFEPSKVIVGK